MLAGLGTSPNQPLPPNQLPADLIYEYHFDVEALMWRSWEALVPAYEVYNDFYNFEYFKHAL